MSRPSAPQRSRFAASALSLSALAGSVSALFLLLWVIVPAPMTALWLVAVVAGEWSLYFGLLGLISALLGVAATRRGRTMVGSASILCGTFAVALSLYPLLATLPVAASNGVQLSLARYLFASPAPASLLPQTFEFAQVDGRTLRLDAYLPEASPVSEASALASHYRPAVVVVHGGSWKSGGRGDFPQWNAWLAAHGYAVFDIDYRLSLQPNWQSATSDVKRAVVWIKEHAGQFNIDPARMALLGRSAGGHLALLAAYTAQEMETGEACGEARVRAVVAFYAPTDLRWGYFHPANQWVIDGPATLRSFTGGTPDAIPEVYRQASPISYAGHNSPPTLLIHGGHDQLVRPENMSRLMQSLQSANVSPRPVEADQTRDRSLFIPYAQHGFDYNFNGWGAQVTQRVLLDFLDANLRENSP